jgi:hypothetical protein
MSKTRIYLATAIDKEIGSTTYYIMDSENSSRIQGEDLEGIESALAEIEEQTGADLHTRRGLNFLSEGERLGNRRGSGRRIC